MSKNCRLYLLHQLVEVDHDDVTRWGCGYSGCPRNPLSVSPGQLNAVPNSAWRFLVWTIAVPGGRVLPGTAGCGASLLFSFSQGPHSTLTRMGCLIVWFWLIFMGSIQWNCSISHKCIVNLCGQIHNTPFSQISNHSFRQIEERMILLHIMLHLFFCFSSVASTIIDEQSRWKK